MNKLTKAGIATAAAVALLMGGAGTLAYWNSSANLGAGSTITAGNLTVAASGTAGSWDKSLTNIVPGDTLTFTRDITVTAVGGSLTATLALAPGSITATSGSAADAALATALGASAEFSVTGTPAGVTVAGDNKTVTFNASSGPITQTLTVSVKITFPLGDEGDYNTAKLGSVSLSDFGVVLTQTH